MKKNILVLNGNPKASSFGHQLSDDYEIEAREYFNVKRFNLADMNFKIDLKQGYDQHQPLEACLVDLQNALKQCDHFVIVTPIWWGGLPAKLKGLIDRTFLSGFAFVYQENNPLPIQLLTDKTARIIMTMDAPDYYLQTQANPVIEQLDVFTLQFSGFKKAKINLFGSLISSSIEERNTWQDKVKALGAEGL